MMQRPGTGLREAVQHGRSFLFVPGDRPERFPKAYDSGADVVILDLEDAVPRDRKDIARREVRAWLERETRPTLVRVSGTSGSAGVADLTAIADVADAVGVVVAKAASASELAQALRRLPAGSLLLPLVETAAGILDVYSLAVAPGVVRLLFGHLDLASDLGLDPERSDLMAPARFAVVVASAAAGLPAPVDGVCTDLRTADKMRREALNSLQSGFPAKMCIHPAQIPILHDALRPSPEELDHAHRVVAAVRGTGVGVVDGAMVDPPVVRRAEAVLARARQSLTDRSQSDARDVTAGGDR